MKLYNNWFKGFLLIALVYLLVVYTTQNGHRDCMAFIAFQGCLIYSLHPNISMQGIYTVLYTFPLYNQELLEFATILLFSWPYLMIDSGWYCQEKLDAYQPLRFKGLTHVLLSFEF